VPCGRSQCACLEAVPSTLATGMYRFTTAPSSYPLSPIPFLK